MYKLGKDMAGLAKISICIKIIVFQINASISLAKMTSYSERHKFFTIIVCLPLDSKDITG